MITGSRTLQHSCYGFMNAQCASTEVFGGVSQWSNCEGGSALSLQSLNQALTRSVVSLTGRGAAQTCEHHRHPATHLLPAIR